MRALFILQDHVSPVGPVGEQLEARGYAVEEFLVVPESRFHDPNVAAVFPDPRDFDLIVPMGAPWSVYDEPTIGAWILEELTFLRTAHQAGVPVLGICFGGQALATALGGGVERAPEAEVGWYEIESDLPGLVEPGPWFQWHHDRWIAPPGAEVIARTPVSEQAYTIGRSMGVQFHPELTPEELAGWLENGGSVYLETHGGDAEALMEHTVATAAEAQARSRLLVDRFLDQVASRPEG